MTTEPKYTDAQIEAMAKDCRAWRQGEVTDMLRSLLSERQAAMRGQGGEARYTRDQVNGWRNDAFENAAQIVERYAKNFPGITHAADDIRALMVAALQPLQPVRSVSDEITGVVSGYLPKSRAIEVLADEAIPEWLKNLPCRVSIRVTVAAIAQEKQS